MQCVTLVPSFQISFIERIVEAVKWLSGPVDHVIGPLGGVTSAIKSSGLWPRR